MTGATGSGKTTTRRDVDELNRSQHIHILTREDPIEFLHPHQCALFNQRDWCKDFPICDRFASACARRRRPVWWGDSRSRDNEIAMTASETGHNRLHHHAHDQCRPDHQPHPRHVQQRRGATARQRLADTVRFVVEPRLVGRSLAGELLVTEIMEAACHARDLALWESEGRTFQEIIEAGGRWAAQLRSMPARSLQDGRDHDETALTSARTKQMRRDMTW